MKRSRLADYILKIKQKFCRHRYPVHWSARYTSVDTVTFYRICPKCGKWEEIEMPIVDIDGPMRRLQKLRSHYKV